MRFIKPFLIGAAGLFIAVTLLSLLLPSEAKVSRAVVIYATNDKVYAQIANLRNWKNWQPMFMSDSSVIDYTDSCSTFYPSCYIKYKERQVHLVMTSVDSSSIKFNLQSKGEENIFNEITITPVKAQGGVQVEWKALVKLKWYPWEKFYGIFVDGITGPGYEDALNHLKDFVEKNHS